jgi:CheY-like chemotaxis protein/DNA-binding XRE family transcriptional regulator
MDISAKIQLIREQRGLSQEELARTLNVSFPTVNSWERGKSQPYPRHRRAIEELYQAVLAEDSERLVLIVEDDPSSAMVLADYVSMALPDWSTRTANDGYTAMIQLGLLRPRIVLLDIMMPDIDGFAVFARVREMDELADTRVIFVTAATDEAVHKRARDAGAFDLIQKPLSRPRIMAALQEAAGQPVVP